MKEDHQNLLRERETIENEILKFEKEGIETDPVLKHTMTLYSSISCIRWMYDSERIQGYIASPTTLQSFDFDEEEDPFIVSNKIWDMMENDD